MINFSQRFKRIIAVTLLATSFSHSCVIAVDGAQEQPGNATRFFNWMGSTTLSLAAGTAKLCWSTFSGTAQWSYKNPRAAGFLAVTAFLVYKFGVRASHGTYALITRNTHYLEEKKETLKSKIETVNNSLDELSKIIIKLAKKVNDDFNNCDIVTISNSAQKRDKIGRNKQAINAVRKSLVTMMMLLKVKVTNKEIEADLSSKFYKNLKDLKKLGLLARAQGGIKDFFWQFNASDGREMQWLVDCLQDAQRFLSCVQTLKTQTDAEEVAEEMIQLLKRMNNNAQASIKYYQDYLNKVECVIL